MNMKKLLCSVMAMLLALSAMALAEPEAEADLQAQLDAANARVAELEAQIELYKPYYEKQVVAEFGDDGIIWRDDAMKEYEAAASAYAQYGLSIDDYADGIKEDILKSLVKSAVIDAKAEALGLSQLDDETIAKLQTEAAESFENYLSSYKSYFAADAAWWKQYDDQPASEFGEKMNDTYLKANAQSEGTKSYGAMVDLLLAEFRQAAR